MTFADLLLLLRLRCKVTIPINERDEWERWFTDQKAEAATLRGRIKDAEAEINARVYRLFDLSPTEVASIEESLALASPGVGVDAYEAISAVEGLHIPPDMRERLAALGPDVARAA